MHVPVDACIYTEMHAHIHTCVQNKAQVREESGDICEEPGFSDSILSAVSVPGA